MRANRKQYVCDDCGHRDEFTSYLKARAAGWAIAKDYEKCYCPSCAPSHRRGGAQNARGGSPTTENGEQIQFNFKNGG